MPQGAQTARTIASHRDSGATSASGPTQVTTASLRDGSAMRALVALFLLFYLPFIFSSGYHLIHTKSVDFPSFYFGAQHAFKDHLSPYGANVFASDAHALHQKVYPYLYPPPSLLAFYPLIHFPYQTAKVLMIVINQVMLWLFAYLLFARLLSLDLRTARGTSAFAFFVAYVLSYQPIADTLFNGQINLIVTTLIMMSWVSAREKRSDLWIAVPLVAAIILKTYPILLLPVLLFMGRVRAAIATVIGLALVTALAYVVLPHVVWSDWLLRVAPTGGYGSIPLGLFSPAATQNQSLNGFFTRLLAPNKFTDTVLNHPGWIKPLGYSTAAVVLSITYAAGLRWRAVRRDAVDVAFSIVLIAMFVVAPLSWIHHAVYVLPAAIVLLQRAWLRSKSLVLGTIALLSALVLAWDLPFDYPSLHAHPAILVLLVSYKLYGALILWAIGVRQLIVLTRTAHEPRMPGAHGQVLPSGS